MKKLGFWVGMAAAMLLMAACERQEPVTPGTEGEGATQNDTTATDSVDYSSFADVEDLVGLWVRVDTPRLGYCSYEISQTQFTYRPDHRGYIDNKVFVCTSHDNWADVKSNTYDYSFDAESQSIKVIILGPIANLTRISKDSARLQSGLFKWDCIVYRVDSVRIEN